MKNVRGYCRISTTRVEQETSLENQKARIIKYCQDRGYNLIKCYEDIASGKDMRRYWLGEMIKQLQQGEIVIVVDISRLSRSRRDFWNLMDEFKLRGIGFTDVSETINTTTPYGEFILSIQISQAQLERQLTAAKVSGAMKSLSSQGRLRSCPPFGWKFVSKDRDFEPEPYQQQVLEKIKRMHLEGMNLTKIANVLNQAGDNRCLVNNKKTPEKFKDPLFYPTTIKRILVENGVVEGGKMKRVPLERRIVSHHKLQQ